MIVMVKYGVYSSRLVQYAVVMKVIKLYHFIKFPALLFDACFNQFKLFQETHLLPRCLEETAATIYLFSLYLCSLSSNTLSTNFTKRFLFLPYHIYIHFKL